MPGKRVMLVGDWAHRDFREAVDWLATHTASRFVSSVAAGLAALQRAEELLEEPLEEPEGVRASVERPASCESPPRPLPEVIVIVQSRPGQIQPFEVEQLHAASPLSRLVVLAGSWCEGELRSGQPFPGVMRVLWHQWQPRLMPFLQAAAAPVVEAWQMPRTASLDERLGSTVGASWPRRGGLIAVHAETFSTYSALSEACRAGGYATVWHVADAAVAASGVVAALADGISCDAVGRCFLRQVVRGHRPAPVIALLDFVRRQDEQAAKAEGVFGVLAKPFLVYDLLWHLDGALD